MNNMNLKRKRSEKGQSLVLMAACIVVLCIFAALALDYGMMAVYANQLQRACDASALAAAGQYMTSKGNNSSDATSETDGKNMGVSIANQNGVTISTSNVVFTGTLGTSTPRRVTVTATGTQTFFLARVFGASGGSVTRKATSEISPVKSMTGGAPLGITQNDYTNNKGTGNPMTVTMERIQSGDFTDGEIVGMDISPSNSKSPAHWENEVANGSGDLMDTAPGATPPTNTSINASRGNQSGRLESAINTRLNAGQDTLTIMVTQPQTQNNGTTNMPMLGLATIKITGIYTVGNGNSKLAYFSFIVLDGVLVAEGNVQSIYAPSELTSPYTGNSYTIRLVDDI